MTLGRACDLNGDRVQRFSHVCAGGERLDAGTESPTMAA